MVCYPAPDAGSGLPIIHIINCWDRFYNYFILLEIVSSSTRILLSVFCTHYNAIMSNLTDNISAKIFTLYLYLNNTDRIIFYLDYFILLYYFSINKIIRSLTYFVCCYTFFSIFHNISLLSSHYLNALKVAILNNVIT